MNIHKRINANFEFKNINIHVIDMNRRLKESGRYPLADSNKLSVNKVRDKMYELRHIDTWVKASKQMRHEGRLIGVGIFLKSE